MHNRESYYVIFDILFFDVVMLRYNMQYTLQYVLHTFYNTIIEEIIKNTNLLYEIGIIGL